MLKSIFGANNNDDDDDDNDDYNYDDDDNDDDDDDIGIMLQHNPLALCLSLTSKLQSGLP